MSEHNETIRAILASHSIEDETKIACVVRTIMTAMSNARLTYNEAECVLKLCAEKLKFEAVVGEWETD